MAISSRGTVLKCAFGTSTGTFTPIGEVLNIDGPDSARENRIDVTSLGTTGSYRQYINDGFIDPGSLSFSMNYNPLSSAGTTALQALFLSGSTKRWHIVVGGASSGQLFKFNAYMSQFAPSFAIGEQVTADCALAITGTVSWP